MNNSGAQGPFRGRFEIKLDPKGRLALPASYRHGTGLASSTASTAQLVVTNSRHRDRSCLDVYTRSEWEKLERRIGRLSSLKPEVQAFNRFYMSGGQEIELDAQNRMLVPQSLRRFAGLETHAVLVGLGAKFEIWSLNLWSEIYEQLTENFETTMAAVAALEASEGVAP